MSQVLGIDIGSYSAKFAVLDIKKSSVILKNVFEIPIPHRIQPGEEKLAKIHAFRQAVEILKTFNLKDNIYAGLGSQYTILQNFDFLKVSLKNLPKLIENEFDALGLFSLDDYLIEYKVLQRTSKHTEVLGMLIKKDAVRDLIETLTAANLTSRIIDIENLSFQNLASYSNQLDSEGTTHLLVNIGHSKTSVSLIKNQQIVSERSSNLAGFYITKRIQDSCGITYEEAQNLKHDVSGSVEYHSNHGVKAKALLLECIHEISKEINNIVLGFTQSSELKKIDSLLITGGTAKIYGLAQTIEKIVGIRTLNINLAKEKFINTCQTDFIFQIYLQAIALALRGTASRINSKINIRHGERSFIGNHESIIAKVFSYAKIASIVVLCLIVTYSIRYYLYNNKINQIKNRFNTQIISYFGSEPRELKMISAKPDWNFDLYSTKALQIIRKTYEQKQNFINGIYSEKSIMPLFVLNEISSAIPKTIYFEVTDYKFQDGLLNIQADTDTKESLNKIIELISSIQNLVNVQKRSETVTAGTNGEMITFSIIATVKSKESS